MKQRAFLVFAVLSLASVNLMGCIAQEPDEIDEIDEVGAVDDEAENTMEAEQELNFDCGEVIDHCMIGCNGISSCEQACLWVC